MNTYVDFETAKLLFDKGFDKKIRSRYITEQGFLNLNKGCLFYSDYELSDKVIYAPTIAEVVMWIFKKYGIWICITPFTNMNGDRFSADTYKNNYKKSHGHNDNPTDAYLKAITHTLKELV